jgi:arylsulfatase A-like enzyme
MNVIRRKKSQTAQKQWLAGCLAAAACQSALGDQKSARPNIVLILADDLGYGDLGIQGAEDLQTPHIDTLFRGGMQFQEAYVAFPTCGPSRASLMTGRHHMRIGFPGNPDHVIPTEPGNLMGLPREEVTLADLLKKQGYATAIVGKWHLGKEVENHPLNRGFDEFFGFLGSLHRYFDLGNTPPPNCLFRGFDRVHEKEYLTHAFTRESIDFIERNQERPFFLFLSHLAVHTPLMYDEDPGPVHIPLDGTDDPGENRRMLINMTENLDRSVGEVMAKLRDLGLEKNTLVVFLSDNGGPVNGQAYSNGLLRGWKGQVFEGGTRVPMAACWPGVIKPGSSYVYPVSAMDLFATSVGLASGTLPVDREYDSRDLMPVLRGSMRERLHDDPLFWDALGMQAIRDGDWKLVMKNRRVEGLYHIPKDPSETENLAAAYPERVRQLRSRYETWEAGLPPPKYKWVGPEKFKEWEKQHGSLRNQWETKGK